VRNLVRLQAEGGAGRYGPYEAIDYTPARLAEFVSSFHRTLIGLTGSLAEIRKTAIAYKVFFARHASRGDYAVDHTGFVYLVGRDGRFLKYLPPGSTPDEIADAIRQQLSAE